jgi:putrescine aminotransferase
LAWLADAGDRDMTGEGASEIDRRDRAHHLHPYSVGGSPLASVEVMVAGRGSYVRTDRGERLFDGAAGLWCVNIGYGRDAMADVMAEQARQLSYASTFANASSAVTTRLAHQLAQLAPPSLNHVFFTTGGSLANETAVRLAHYYFRRIGQPGRRRIITFKHAYHGSTALTARLSGIAAYDHFGDVPGPVDYHVALPALETNGTRQAQVSLRETLDPIEFAITTLGPETVAAIMLEPVLGAGGVRPFPPGHLQAIRALCDRYSVLLIADEVVTGFGRLGHFFSCAPLFGFTPDILTTGKGITSGYFPLAATLFSDTIAGALSARTENDLFPHGFTYSGHPIGCAVALKNIEIMQDEETCAHVSSVGPVFQVGLQELKTLPGVVDVRGCFFMAAVECTAAHTSGADADAAHGERSDAQFVARVAALCRRRGLLVRPLGPHVILSPPLLMTADEARWLIDVLRDSIELASEQTALCDSSDVPTGRVAAE